MAATRGQAGPESFPVGSTPMKGVGPGRDEVLSETGGLTPQATDEPRHEGGRSTTMAPTHERSSLTPPRQGRQRSPRTTVVGRVRAAIWTLLVALILAGVGLAAFSVLSGNWTVAPILSGSMRPGFPVGGVAAAERMPMRSLAVGDVIIFQNPYLRSLQMVHRITQLKVNKSGQPVIKTKGDANPVADPWTVTLHGRYVYVAQFTLPLLGYPAVYTNHSLDLIVAGLILLGVVLATVLTQTHKRKSMPAAAAPWRVKQ